MFANGPGDLGSIPGRVIPKTLKMVLDSALLNTLQYKVRIKDKVEQSRERSSAPLHLGVIAIEKGAFGAPSTTVANITYLLVSDRNTWNRAVVSKLFVLDILDIIEPTTQKWKYWMKSQYLRWISNFQYFKRNWKLPD